VGQALRDQHRANILSARSEYAAGATVVAARCPFRSGATGARDSLKIEATTGDELTKPERRSVAKLTLRRTLSPVGFRCVESHEPEGLTGNANRVAIHYIDLAGFNRSGIRERRDEG
jgi:hypothetical protein